MPQRHSYLPPPPWERRLPSLTIRITYQPTICHSCTTWTSYPLLPRSPLYLDALVTFHQASMVTLIFSTLTSDDAPKTIYYVFEEEYLQEAYPCASFHHTSHSTLVPSQMKKKKTKQNVPKPTPSCALCNEQGNLTNHCPSLKQILCFLHSSFPTPSLCTKTEIIIFTHNIHTTHTISHTSLGLKKDGFH